MTAARKLISSPQFSSHILERGMWGDIEFQIMYFKSSEYGQFKNLHFLGKVTCACQQSGSLFDSACLPG
jgi:hypothetical protein